MPTQSDDRAGAQEALASLLALMLVPAGCTPTELVARLAALDAFRQLGLDRQHFAGRLAQMIEAAEGQAGDRSWLDDSDLARIERLMAPIDDPLTRARLCDVAAAVLGEDASVAHSRSQFLDHVVSTWHVALDPPPAPRGR